MDYKNGKEIFPSDLLEQLQKYVQGNLVYIPKKENDRTGWGEKNGTKKVICSRNREICEERRKGVKLEELASIFCLSEESIRKILRNASK